MKKSHNTFQGYTYVIRIIFTDDISELIDEKIDLESSQDFDGTREFAEESLNEEIKEELIDTVFDITGNEVNSSEVLQKLEELNDEEKALKQIDNIDDYEKEYIGEELKNKLFEDLIDSSIAPVSESGKINHGHLNRWTDIFILPRPIWGWGLKAY